MQPGSLVRWQYRLRLPDERCKRSRRDGGRASKQRQFPDAGWEIRTRSNASPQLERSVERFTQFLTLVGLTALLVGGVGVANAVSGHLDAQARRHRHHEGARRDRRRASSPSIAPQILLVALLAAAIGAALGAALPFVDQLGASAPIIPLPVAPAVHPGVLALAIVYGLLTALAFALWPLGRAHDISVSTLFRDQIAAERRWPRRRYIIATGADRGGAGGARDRAAYDHRIAAIFVASRRRVFVLLRLVAMLMMLDRAPAAAPALDGRCGSPSPTSTVLAR